jgi:hypothetical protein
MKSNDLKRLSIAIAAAAMMSSVTAQQASFDVDPVAFLQDVRAEVAAGDAADALAMIDRLRALGVQSIAAGDTVVSLAELTSLIATGSAEALLVLNQAIAVADVETAAFGVSATTVTADASNDDEDSFPIGSAG